VAGAEVRVTGLIETRNKLRKLDPSLKQVLPKELRGIADFVAKEARQKVPTRSGAAAASIRSRSSQTTATVVAGKKKVPYYGWLDFGTRNPRAGQARSVGPWAGTGQGPKGGRFIYPVIKRNRKRITDAGYAAVAKAKRVAGFAQ
jgi:hypothetical protein